MKNSANESRFWANVCRRLAPGEKLSKIKELYHKQILSYDDLIHLPVLKASAIRDKHNEEIRRQRNEANEQRQIFFDEVLRNAIRTDGCNGFYAMNDKAGILIAFGKDDNIYSRVIDPGWLPRKEVERLRSDDRVLYELLRRRLPAYSKMFVEIEKVFI